MWSGETRACALLKCPVGTTDFDKNPATACNNCQLGIGYTDKAGNTGKCLPVQKCAAGKEASTRAAEQRVCPGNILAFMTLSTSTLR